MHAAGLAVYTGSLYQSSRSSFRPLMRVSSGVRNLIAGGGGGGGGGDAGAGDAPATSPAPAFAAGDAGTEAASETLCAATDAGGTAQAGVMVGVRSEDLTGIQWVDDVAALARRGNVAEACVNPTGLRRGEDTAGQLEALRDALRGDETGAEGEVTSILRVPELDDTVPELGDTASVHEASALDIVGNIGSQADGPRHGCARIAFHRFAASAAARGEDRTPRRRRPSASAGGVGAHIFQGQYQTALPLGPLRQNPQLGHGRGRRGCARAHLR